MVYVGLTYLRPAQSLTSINVNSTQSMPEVSSNTSTQSASLDDDLTALDRDLNAEEDVWANFNNEFKKI